MAEKQINAVLRLRRDSENNFNRSNIILQSGEAAIVATPFNGTQVKIGDGRTPFRDLKYETFGLLARGFKSGELFYATDNITPLDPVEHILFLDLNTGFLYYWDPSDQEYKHIAGSIVPVATETVDGIMKLYDTINGNNTDGSVTQRAINNAFTSVQTAANNILWQMDDSDDEMLVSSFSDLQNLNVLQ